MRFSLFLMSLLCPLMAQQKLTFTANLGDAAPTKSFSIQVSGPANGCVTYAPLGMSAAASGNWNVTVNGPSPETFHWSLVGVERPDSGRRPGFIYLAIQICGSGGGDYRVTGKSE